MAINTRNQSYERVPFRVVIILGLRNVNIYRDEALLGLTVGYSIRKKMQSRSLPGSKLRRDLRRWWWRTDTAAAAAARA